VKAEVAVNVFDTCALFVVVTVVFVELVRRQRRFIRIPNLGCVPACRLFEVSLVSQDFRVAPVLCPLKIEIRLS